MTSVGAATRRTLAVLAVVVLALFCVVQAINRPIGTGGTAYRAEFGDVFGLHQNADVRIRGVRVGKVEEITLTAEGTALVRFALRKGEVIDRSDRLFIRFQNLVGQRYVDIRRGAPVGTVPADSTIPVEHTTGSFDVTTMFNGLRPILRGADPAVFNRFAENLIALVHGEDGVGVGTVLRDIDHLAAFATDRTAVIRVIVANLGAVATELSGDSAVVDVLVDNVNILFGTFDENQRELVEGFERGSRIFPKLVEILERTSELGLGGHDRLDDRIMELAPASASAPIGGGLRAIPGMLDQAKALLDGIDSNLTCANGRVPVPELAGVLLGEGKVTLCRR